MKIFNGLAAICLMLVGFSPVWGGQGVQWETDFKTAMKTAEETNRLVLIHFYGDQCPPCRMMDKEIFPQKAVADALVPYFVPLKVNTEQNPKAVQNLNITSIPMDLIVTPQREIIFRRKGGCSAEQYVDELLSVIQALQVQREAEMTDAERLQIAKVENRPRQTEPGPVFQTELTPPGLQVPQAQTVPVTPVSEESPVVSQTAVLDTPVSETPELFVPNEPLLAEAAAPVVDDFALPDEPLTAPAETAASTDGEMLFADNAAPAASTGEMTGLSIPNLQTIEEQENLGYESPYVLDGFCPVELQDNEHWVAGKTEFALHYRDRFILFSSKEAMKAFSKNPHLYTPVAMGEDIVQMIQGGQRIKGKRHYGAWYQGRIYLFSTQENYNSFSERPSYFADFALKLESALGQTQISANTK